MTRWSLSLVVVAVIGCDFIPKSLDEADCRAWAEHYVALGKSAAAEAAEACGKEAAAPAALIDKMRRNAEEVHDKRRDAFLAECRGDVGKKYERAEERCFRDAKHAKDWASCPLKIGVLFHLKDAAKQIASRAERDCIDFLEGNEGKKK